MQNRRNTTPGKTTKPQNRAVSRRSREYQTVLRYVRERVRIGECEQILVDLLKGPPMSQEEVENTFLDKAAEMSDETVIGLAVRHEGISSDFVEGRARQVWENYGDLSMFDYRVVEAVLRDEVDGYHAAKDAQARAETLLPGKTEEIGRIVNSLDPRTKITIAAILELCCTATQLPRDVVDDGWPVERFDLDHLWHGAGELRQDKDLQTLVQGARLARDLSVGGLVF
ncbi:MAG: hypothetical protein M1376_10865 [Planctomycetes bacterium]|nr:hypothetical protein [Planctomycetota bacterium]